MAADALIDTGAILAALDRTDRWHGACIEIFQQVRLPLVTSEAVLAELFPLGGDSRHEMEIAWRFIRSGAIRVKSIEDAELPEIQTLRSRCSDGPMNFADATLVYLARRESLFTVDQADFNTCRMEGRKRFRVSPGSRR